MLETIIRLLLIVMGIIIVLGTLTSAIRTFILARRARDRIMGFVFLNIRRIFNIFLRFTNTYEGRDNIMALYAPIALISLPMVWLSFVGVGYTLIFWGLGTSLRESIILSGSSLFTLGFFTNRDMISYLLEFSESLIGLILIAILIAYLPTMYAAFARRESAVTLLEVRAGMPPSPVELLLRAHRIKGFTALPELWSSWEEWFVELEESHTTLPALVFFRSVRSNRSWITASGVVLDAAAIYLSCVDTEREASGALCIRAGYISLRYIADFFNIEYDDNPKPDDPISISREEFDEVYDELLENGVPMNTDREQCWNDFRGWRVNYDVPLIALASLTMAPYGMWSSDRSLLNVRTESFEMFKLKKKQKK